MATHYINLTPGVTAKHIKDRFAAFELLYGESDMFVRWGTIPVRDSKGDSVYPLFLTNVNARIAAVGSKNLTITIREDDNKISLIVPLDQLYPRISGEPQPEIMFITKR